MSSRGPYDGPKRPARRSQLSILTALRESGCFRMGWWGFFLRTGTSDIAPAAGTEPLITSKEHRELHVADGDDVHRPAEPAAPRASSPRRQQHPAAAATRKPGRPGAESNTLCPATTESKPLCPASATNVPGKSRWRQACEPARQLPKKQRPAIEQDGPRSRKPGASARRERASGRFEAASAGARTAKAASRQAQVREGRTGGRPMRKAERRGRSRAEARLAAGG